MLTYFVGRVAQFLLVIIGAMTVVFFALNIATDPATLALPLGTPPQVLEQFRRAHGLSGSVFDQAWHFLTRAVRGDFGQSIWLGGDALHTAISRVPATLELVLPATILGSLLGVLMAMIASRRPGRIIDQSLNVASLGMLALAEFWLAIMLILVFAVRLGWLPSAGDSPKPAAYVLPAMVLAVRPFAQMFQLGRVTMIDERSRGYVVTARSKGLSEKEVVKRHILRNAAIPLVTLGFYEVSRVFVGAAVIVEVIFAWPGIGYLAVEALQRGDVFLVEATVLVAAFVVALVNLAADMLYFALDPRTRSLLSGLSR